MKSIEHQQKFDTAQKYEANWWVWYIENELKPPSRDWMVGNQDRVGRGHLARFGLNKENRFWSLNPPAIDGSILDLGSSIISFFEGKDMKVVAVEPTLHAMQRALPDLVQIGQVRNVYYHPGEIYDVDWDTFDNVWCCNMLDHTPDWATILDVEIPRVLKPNGRLYLSVDCRRTNVKLDAGHLTAFMPQWLMERHLNKHFVRIWDSGEKKPDYFRWDYIGVKKQQ